LRRRLLDLDLTIKAVEDRQAHHGRHRERLAVELERKSGIRPQRRALLGVRKAYRAALLRVAGHAHDLADLLRLETSALLAAKLLAEHEPVVRVLLGKATDSRAQRESRCVLPAGASERCGRRP